MCGYRCVYIYMFVHACVHMCVCVCACVCVRACKCASDRLSFHFIPQPHTLIHSGVARTHDPIMAQTVYFVCVDPTKTNPTCNGVFVSVCSFGLFRP
jgi:hypothetical protein